MRIGPAHIGGHPAPGHVRQRAVALPGQSFFLPAQQPDQHHQGLGPGGGPVQLIARLGPPEQAKGIQSVGGSGGFVRRGKDRQSCHQGEGQQQDQRGFQMFPHGHPPFQLE